LKAKARNVGDYLNDLEGSMGGRTEQVKDGLQIYIGLWKRAIEKGVVSERDDVETALVKLESKGGLYKASE
jgi:hypothetical protein